MDDVFVVDDKEEWRKRILFAKSIDDLMSALGELEFKHWVFCDQEKMAEMYAKYEIDLFKLPNFGGSKPDIPHLFSWSPTKALVWEGSWIIFRRIDAARFAASMLRYKSSEPKPLTH